MAGLTVALVLIPQSMAYAQLAGLPSYYGLYASLLPPLTAALFGSSRQLSTGPVAVVSLMTAASLEPVASAGTSGFIAYAIMLAFMVGTIQFLLGVFRLGLLVNLLSHPVINGFSNASAIIIGASQLSKLFGVQVDSAPHEYETFIRVLKAAFHYTHWPTFIIGNAAFLLMYVFGRITRRLPGVLIVVILTSFVSWAIGFEKNITIPLSQIEDPDTQALIRKINRSIKTVSTLKTEKFDILDTLTEVKKCGDPLTIMEVEFKAEVTGHKIDLENISIQSQRKSLRSILLRPVPETGSGPQRFSVVDSSSSEGRNSGPLWRIKVGNTALSEESIPLTGGGDVVGHIPQGLPKMDAPDFDLVVMMQLVPYALIIAVLGFTEAISIAKAMSAKTGQRINPDQELIGQGLGNLLGSFSGCYPVSGSFSRSAVNLQSGAVSGVSSIVTSLTVVVVLLFLTRFFYHLPQAVLGAVIMMSVVGLINVKGFISAWKAQWYDGVISVITFFCTLYFAPHLDRGIFVGVVLSLSVFLYKSMRPTVVDLSLGVDKALHNVVEFGLKECRYIDVVRFDGPLFFANASYLEDQIAERRQKKKELRHIIIVANGINDLDASGQESLSLVVDRLRSAGIGISLCGVNGAVRAVMRRTHLDVKIGPENVYPVISDAIRAIHGTTHADSEEQACPLINIVRKTDEQMIQNQSYLIPS